MIFVIAIGVFVGGLTVAMTDGPYESKEDRQHREVIEAIEKSKS